MLYVLFQLNFNRETISVGQLIQLHNISVAYHLITPVRETKEDCRFSVFDARITYLYLYQTRGKFKWKIVGATVLQWVPPLNDPNTYLLLQNVHFQMEGTTACIKSFRGDGDSLVFRVKTVFYFTLCQL